jgi:hypothetical protein
MSRATQHYLNDPLGGDKRAHGIAKQLRHRTPRRQIAKRFHVTLGNVNEVARRIGLDPQEPE